MDLKSFRLRLMLGDGMKLFAQVACFGMKRFVNNSEKMLMKTFCELDVADCWRAGMSRARN